MVVLVCVIDWSLGWCYTCDKMNMCKRGIRYSYHFVKERGIKI
jgi:hypothetical protein